MVPPNAGRLYRLLPLFDAVYLRMFTDSMANSRYPALFIIVTLSPGRWLCENPSTGHPIYGSLVLSPAGGLGIVWPRPLF
ncbi:hypothetical protein [Candidatus Sodalis sp. SoCistrobi]|uniref:hypothetical protein n=1 Tax=Candidatus Sodalis sp. SoCistrobi TaxID=1922216 RepID=UPI00093CF485|nr:hypothetical protein [Candidatus Sodalis sp. SoCistrobi]